MDMLSRRGARLAEESPLADYIVEHFGHIPDRWHANDNPEGYIPLCIAENNLLTDLFAERLARVPAPPARVLGYDAMIGALPFREQLADFMAASFLGRRFAPEQIAAVAGAGTVLELLFYALADPGDAVLVPTPSYAGFWPDLETRDGLHIVPVPCSSEDGFELSVELLEEALRGADRPVRALLFTNPDNPLGKIASPAQLERILHWAEQHQLHVVFDEIYALSVFGSTAFTSVAALRPQLGPRVHIVWAFSKDFGASGLRCGVLVSENEALLAAVDGLAYWGAISGHTQWVLGDMISDQEWVAEYRAELRTRLAAAHRRTTTALDEAGVAALPAEGGIFVLCDFREYLEEESWAGEAALWRRLLDECRVNISPGSACRIAEPGFMRLCYAAGPQEEVVAGIARIAAALR